MKSFLGLSSLKTTLYKEKKGSSKKKKKRLVLGLLIDKDDSNLNKEMSLITKKFKKFHKKKVGSWSKKFVKGG